MGYIYSFYFQIKIPAPGLGIFFKRDKTMMYGEEKLLLPPHACANRTAFARILLRSRAQKLNCVVCFVFLFN